MQEAKLEQDNAHAKANQFKFLKGLFFGMAVELFLYIPYNQIIKWYIAGDA